MPDIERKTIPICSCLIEHHEDGTVIERRDPHCRVHGDGTRIFSVTPIPPDKPNAR